MTASGLAHKTDVFQQFDARFHPSLPGKSRVWPAQARDYTPAPEQAAPVVRTDG